MKQINVAAKGWHKLVSILTLCLFALNALSASAQNVTGTVYDSEGETAIGAYVTVVGTTLGTATDIDGRFSIKAEPGQTIEISLIGYIKEQIKVEAGKTDYVVTLKPDTQNLDEVVVIGYGTLEKKRVTSSITSISGDQLTNGLGGSTIATALQGKISGMTISGSSSPNASNGYQLRGVSSLNGSSAPLVVIDGIPGGDIRAINQEDVESIDVLKDASAGAIYGTRASAGVILITTKKAKEGKVSVNYSFELAVESVRKRLDMLSSEEFLEYGRGYDYGYDTDWYAELCRDTPVSNRHSLTINGGSETLQLYSSLVYSDQKGIVIGDGRKDYSARLNGVYNMFGGRVQLGLKTQFRQTDRDQRNGSTSFEQTLLLNPTTPLMNPSDPNHYNVNDYGIGTSYNPVGDINDQEYLSQDKWFIGDLSLKIKLTDNLTAQATYGIDQRQNQFTRYYNQYHRNSILNQKLGRGTHSFSKDVNKSTEAYLSYLNVFKDVHRVDAVAGWSFYEENGESFSMTNSNFTVDGIGPWDMGAGTDLVAGEASISSSKDPRERLLSFFGRASYSFNDQYMATVSYRREGSSKFGPNNRWGNFWSVSGGWRISNESFMQQVDWVKDLKLRVGYGVTGNNNFGSGYTVRNYTSGSAMYPTPEGSWIPTYGTARNINKDLKWEQKKEFNVGIDYALFNNRISGKFDWFSRTVDDMLLSVNAPVPPMVAKTVMKNVGTLDNKGWEFEITGDILQAKDFSWTSTFRISHSSSKIKNLGEETATLQPSDALPQSMGHIYKHVNGSTIGQFWLYKYAGLDEDGKWLIYDKDNNVVPASGNTNDANRHYVGNGVPKLTMSMEHNLRYRAFDFGISFRSWYDYDVFDETALYYGLKTVPGTNLLKIAYTNNAAINDTRITTDYFLNDASFVKIDALSLGYTLNLSKWNNYVSRARVYVTARDLVTWTKYKGYNPEVDVNGVFPGDAKVRSTSSMYPQTTRWTFGAQLTF